ncbi:hypothetical protein QBC38DRAFT_136191 [Podospora fimiseda]|uniref:Fungal N-terminal domain-containing protein n=1 Tax=Podospora fimiseda TaxID=252190 RepID=A0AAN7H1R3_9PEZI|nr:hypothetical protein QBC38DRAFT_136191 [Podospora fimiseda]
MVEVVGTISAAIILIDFVTKITKVAKKLCGALDDGISEYDRLRKIAKSLQDSIESLENTNTLRPSSSNSALTDCVKSTLEISKVCLEVVDEMVKLIDKVSIGLRVPTHMEGKPSSSTKEITEKMKGFFRTKYSKSHSKNIPKLPVDQDIDNMVSRLRAKLGTSWGGAKVAIAVMWHEGELDGLRNEFNLCTNLLALHWNTVFRHEEQSKQFDGYGD